MLIVHEEPTGQTAPSFMPVIKAAVGGRVWERSREDMQERELVQDCHLLVVFVQCRQ